MNKLAAEFSQYLFELCDELQAQRVSVADIDITVINSLLTNTFDSILNGEAKEYTKALLEQNSIFLEQTIASNNLLFTILLLQNIACQCLSLNEQSDTSNIKLQQIHIQYNDYIDLLKERTEYIEKASAKKYIQASQHPFTGKGVIYTAVTGGYDNILDPEYVSPNFDYICFTDNPDFTSTVWQTRIIENPENLDNIRLARKLKCKAIDLFPEYDFSIWLDGKFCFKKDPTDLINCFSGGKSLLAFPHYERQCIYEEAEACLVAGKGVPAEILSQVEKMKNNGYPENYGLVDTGCLIRSHHDPQLKKTMDFWWNEIQNGSTRDQLSFNYSCYMNNFDFDLCNLYLYQNSYIKTVGHKQ